MLRHKKRVIMKKIIITLLLLFPLMTGCSNINANLDLLNKNTALFSAKLHSEKNIDKNEISLIKENFAQFLDGDYITDISFSNDLAKIDAVKLVKNIKKNDLDLSSVGFKTNLKSGRFVEVKNNPFITFFNVDLTYDLQSQSKRIEKIKKIKNTTQTAGLKPEYLQKYGDTEISLDDVQDSINEDLSSNLEDSYADKAIIDTELQDNDNEAKPNETKTKKSEFSPKFSITLPSSASFNNADKVVDDTYYWNIRKSSPTNIKLQYIIYNSFTISLLLITIFALLFLLAKKILKHDSQKRIGSNN